MQNLERELTLPKSQRAGLLWAHRLQINLGLGELFSGPAPGIPGMGPLCKDK